MDYPTTPDLTIELGDKVRSFDFPGHNEVYRDGIVTSTLVKIDGVKYYAITDFKNKTFYAPHNGQETTFLRVTMGVAKLD